MIKLQRKLKSSIVLPLVVAMIICIPCFTTACKPTPKSSIVQNKSDDDLKNAIRQTAGSQLSVLKAHETGTFSNSSNTVTVNIDADVTTPNISKIPVAEVEQITVSPAQIERIIKAFFGNDRIYDAKVTTKADVEATIMFLQQKSNDKEYLLNCDYAKENHITDLNAIKRHFNDKIKESQKQLASAPENRPEIPGYDAALTQAGLYACVDLGKEYMGYVEAYDWKAGPGQSIHLYAFGGDKSKWFRSLNYGLSTPIAQDLNEAAFQSAKQKANQMIADMGIEGVTLGETYRTMDNRRGIEISSGREFYVFCFQRVVGDVPLNFNFVSNMLSTSKSDSEDEYDHVLPYETIQIWMEGDQFRQFSWTAPMTVKRIINDNVALSIDYQRAIDLMKQQAFVRFVDAENYSNTKVDINSIKLEILRIKQRDTGSYLVVPAWVAHGQVAGAVTQKYVDAHKSHDLSVDQYVPWFVSIDDSILVINALDGSAINIMLGY